MKLSEKWLDCRLISVKFEGIFYKITKPLGIRRKVEGVFIKLHKKWPE